MKIDSDDCHVRDLSTAEETGHAAERAGAAAPASVVRAAGAAAVAAGLEPPHTAAAVAVVTVAAAAIAVSRGRETYPLPESLRLLLGMGVLG
ncbi:hypothetical protein CLOP_g13853 [Closterium sp. NIES-67]|nr:hypothetical protein CLOP_g13853 [Closterium sp. NIES-67]